MAVQTAVRTCKAQALIYLIIDCLNLIDLVRQLADIVIELYSRQNNVHILGSRIQDMPQILDRYDAIVDQAKYLIQDQQTTFTGRENLLCKIETVFDIVDLILLALVRKLCKFLLTLLDGRVLC